MPIVAILNQKGGSGKTTIATNLAYSIQLDGYRTLLVDSDPQGSTRDWNQANDASLVPVIGLDRETLPKDLDRVAKGYDWVIIDGAPQIARMSAAAVKAADVVLIPVQPSPYDVWATADLVDIIKTRNSITDGKLKAAFVISRAIKNTRLSKEIHDALNEYALHVFRNYTTQFIVYPTTASKGLTVFNSNKSPAIQEIVGIKTELYEFVIR